MPFAFLPLGGKRLVLLSSFSLLVYLLPFFPFVYSAIIFTVCRRCLASHNNNTLTNELANRTSRRSIAATTPQNNTNDNLLDQQQQL